MAQILGERPMKWMWWMRRKRITWKTLTMLRYGFFRALLREFLLTSYSFSFWMQDHLQWMQTL
ncbi:hypothetical protein OR221_0451 [Microbacterium laevaniformans OR221]|nr:hypothetical protein OR221_0451 [Microbacterium laevaniformans OR221]